jgi:hypothetical protein
LRTLIAMTSHQGHEPPAPLRCLHHRHRRCPKIGIVPLDPMHVVVTALAEPPAVAKRHQNLVRLQAPIGRVSQIAPVTRVGNVVKRDPLERPAGRTLTPMALVVERFAERPVRRPVVSLEPFGMSHGVILSQVPVTTTDDDER